MPFQQFSLDIFMRCTATIILLSITGGCASVPQSKAQSMSVISPLLSQTEFSAEMALARHLQAIGAKMYGAYWCPHCKRQKQMFGAEAVKQINYIECDAQGQNPRPDLCRKAHIQSFPTWEINGNFYRGMQSLNNLADLSGYHGDRNFKLLLVY